jgi:uncharacterized protein (TIGR03067 family)
MRRVLTSFLGLLLVLQYSVVPAMGQEDSRRIVGRWRPLKLTIPGQHHITPEQLEHIVLTFEDGGTYTSTGGPQVEKGTYELDPAKEPKWITMTVQQGPAAGSTMHGIYSFTNDHLTIVYPLQPGAPRPTRLSTQDAGSWVTVEYIRLE